MSTTTTGRVERWMLTDAGSAVAGRTSCGFFSSAEAADATLKHCNSKGNSFRVVHLREVDPAADAAVARVIEAARKLVAKVGGMPGPVVSHMNHEYWDLDRALSAFPSPAAAPVAEKQVRCWRHKTGFVCDADRIRWTGEQMESVLKDGQVVPTSNYTVADAERYVKEGEWVECHDVPVAPPPAPAVEAVPPEGTRWVWKSSHDDVYDFEVRAGRLVAIWRPTGEVLSKPGATLEELRKRVATGECAEHPPSPTPRAEPESAEAAGLRWAYEIRKSREAIHVMLARFITADRAAHRAEVERLTKERDEAWLNAKNTEIALTGQASDFNARIAELEAEVDYVKSSTLRAWNEENAARVAAESQLAAKGGGVDADDLISRQVVEELKHKAWAMGYARGQHDAGQGRDILNLAEWAIDAGEATALAPAGEGQKGGGANGV